jgi:hypothetical protein
MNQIEIPFINPLHWIPVNPNQPRQYYTKYAYDWAFEDTLYNWQETLTRYRPVRCGDPIKNQFTANFGSILIQCVDCMGNVVYSQNATQVRANKYLPGYFLYQFSCDTTGFPPGRLYRFLMIPSGDTADEQKTEWLYVDTEQPNTILWEYWHNRYHEDVVFETGIVFSMRLPGFFEEKAPGSVDVIYTDQVLNNTQLSSRPLENQTLYIGDGGGVPYSWILKANMAFTCLNVKLDNFLWAKSDGAKWNEFAQEGTRVKGYSIDLRPGLNRASRIINPMIDTTKKITFVSQIDGSVFGSIDNSGGTIVTPVTNII